MAKERKLGSITGLCPPPRLWDPPPRLWDHRRVSGPTDASESPGHRVPSIEATALCHQAFCNPLLCVGKFRVHSVEKPPPSLGDPATVLSFGARPHCFFAFAQHRSNVGAWGPAHRDPNPLPQNGSKLIKIFWRVGGIHSQTARPGCAHCVKVVIGTRLMGLRHTRIPALLIRRGVVTPAF